MERTDHNPESVADTVGHILFYEPESGGHRAEFVSYLLEHIAGEESVSGWSYTFAISDELVAQHPELLQMAEKATTASVVPIPVSSRWNGCRDAINRFRPTHLMLMELTSLELALCFVRPPCHVSGILFVQYPELRNGTWPQKLKFILKDLKTRLLLHNPVIRRIFLLNGDASCSYLNHRFKTDCYTPIPDPVLPGEPAPDFRLRELYGLTSDRRIFLFFGSISARKGADVLFEALSAIDPATRATTAFLILGRPEEGYAARYTEQIERMRQLHPEIKLICDNRFFDIPELKAAFQQADWILMPYVRSEYSSGVLAHAASVSTPVIAPNSGLLGRLVKQRKLGLCTAVNPVDLASAMDEACSAQHVYDEDERRAFVEHSNHIDFARIILNGLRND